MPMEWSEESGYIKELRKWEQRGYDPAKHPFPRMLYKAQQNPISNKYEVLLKADVISADRTVVLLDKEQFNASCQLTVNDEAEFRRARDNGWRETPQEAIDHHEALQNAIAEAAAHRAYEDRNMGEKAKDHIAKVEEKTGSQHVAEVPEQPIKHRGRPKGSKNKPKSTEA